MKAASTARKTPTRKRATRSSATAKKASAKKASAKKASAKKASAKRSLARKTPAKKAPQKASRKKTSRKKASTKQKAPAKRAAKKTARKTSSAKKSAVTKPSAATAKANGEEPSAATLLAPVGARPTREERAWAEARLNEIDEVCNAWADIVAERMSADQTFADLVEQLDAHRRRDLRGLFLWDALQAAESQVAMITEIIATHLQDRKADPLAILADLRGRQRQIAAVYSVNAFLAVLNQMKPDKPKWLSMEEVDPRFAVLALAHQTLAYATEAARVSAPPDLTDFIIQATQDDAVWVWRRMPEPGTETLAACAATAAFFRQLGATVLVTTDEVAAHYAERSRTRV